MADEFRNDVQLKITKLRGKFFKTKRYEELSQGFDKLYQVRQSEIEANLLREARGLVLVGESGSGKTTALRRVFEMHPQAKVLTQNEEFGDIATLSIPSPATHKFVGISTLKALGYPLRRDPTAATIWDLAQRHMKARRVLFLHFDEAQDFYSARPSEMTAVVNTLKSIMQNNEWPVGVVLSGMTRLVELLNHDPQLARRITPVYFPQLSENQDLDVGYGACQSYADAIGIALGDDLKSQNFLRRLIYSSAGQLGIMIELIIDALEDALTKQDTTLTLPNFARAYGKRTGSIDGLNPFIIEGYHQVDPRLVLGQVELGGFK